MSLDTPDADEPTNSPDRPLPESVVDEVLESPRRRMLLTHVLAAEDPVPVVDIARQIALREGNDGSGNADAGDPEAIKGTIYDDHLPKLTALRVVEFDSLLAAVSPAENALQVGDRLDAQNEDNP
ncbi:hypothetical protein [Halostella sp. PRR32]|uniref:DUF7344 domain-containing protein n=1 Tax=Halostella sp. PRR32 TaxID=3098147 RepID=UPI002B1E2A36|nr:hypothetical protein [Halostella sp. PRR32]